MELDRFLKKIRMSCTHPPSAEDIATYAMIEIESREEDIKAKDSEIERLTQRVQELESALKPFTFNGDDYIDANLDYNWQVERFIDLPDIRAAREALGGKP